MPNTLPVDCKLWMTNSLSSEAPYASFCSSEKGRAIFSCMGGAVRLRRVSNLDVETADSAWSWNNGARLSSRVGSGDKTSSWIGLGYLYPEEVGRGWPLWNILPGVITNWLLYLNRQAFLALTERHRKAHASQWAWHRKHMTIITSVLEVLWTKCTPTEMGPAFQIKV